MPVTIPNGLVIHDSDVRVWGEDGALHIATTDEAVPDELMEDIEDVDAEDILEELREGDGGA